MSNQNITRETAIQIAKKFIEEDSQRLYEATKDRSETSFVHEMQLTRVIEEEDIWYIEFQPIPAENETIEGGHMAFRIDKKTGVIVG